MGLDNYYRFGVHAVIPDTSGQILMIRKTQSDVTWRLCGGGVEPGETIHDAMKREAREELGIDIEIEALTGMYYHSEFNVQVAIFRCRLPEADRIALKPEYSEYAWIPIAELGEVQRFRVENALKYGCHIASAAF